MYYNDNYRTGTANLEWSIIPLNSVGRTAAELCTSVDTFYVQISKLANTKFNILALLMYNCVSIEFGSNKKRHHLAKKKYDQDFFFFLPWGV